MKRLIRRWLGLEQMQSDIELLLVRTTNIQLKLREPANKPEVDHATNVVPETEQSPIVRRI